MIESLRLAVPSNNPGGLEANRSDHFGHCDLFTIIDIKDNAIAAVGSLTNVEHAAGGCLVPVALLRDQGVEAIVVGGIGARPLQGFNEAGISVYYADRNTVQNVQTVAEGMIAGHFPVIKPDQTCQNQGNCH